MLFKCKHLVYCYTDLMAIKLYARKTKKSCGFVKIQNEFRQLDILNMNQIS